MPATAIGYVVLFTSCSRFVNPVLPGLRLLSLFGRAESEIGK